MPSFVARVGSQMKSPFLSRLRPRYFYLAQASQISTSQSHAGTIGPNDFGGSARIETFDFGTPGVGFVGSLVSNGVSYDFVQPAYTFAAFNSGHCVSGN